MSSTELSILGSNFSSHEAAFRPSSTSLHSHDSHVHLVAKPSFFKKHYTPIILGTIIIIFFLTGFTIFLLISIGKDRTMADLGRLEVFLDQPSIFLVLDVATVVVVPHNVTSQAYISVSVTPSLLYLTRCEYKVIEIDETTRKAFTCTSPNIVAHQDMVVTLGVPHFMNYREDEPDFTVGANIIVSRGVVSIDPLQHPIQVGEYMIDTFTKDFPLAISVAQNGCGPHITDITAPTLALVSARIYDVGVCEGGYSRQNNVHVRARLVKDHIEGTAPDDLYVNTTSNVNVQLWREDLRRLTVGTRDPENDERSPLVGNLNPSDAFPLEINEEITYVYSFTGMDFATVYSMRDDTTIESWNVMVIDKPR